MHIAELIVFAFSENLSAENLDLSAESGCQGYQILKCMHLAPFQQTSVSNMALIGVHFILIILGLDLTQTKYFLVETEDGTGRDKRRGNGNDYQDGRLVSFPMQCIIQNIYI